MISIRTPGRLVMDLENRLREFGRVLAPLTALIVLLSNFLQREWEAGQAGRQHMPELRDRRGRRLRATAYGRSPRGPRRPISRNRKGAGGPPPGQRGWMPAALKVGLVVILAGGAFLGSSDAYINFAAGLPDAHAIAAEPLPEDTFIYAADGATMLADIHPSGLQHYYAALNGVGKYLPMATIAVEDQNFYHEPGIDITATARAAWIDWRQHKAAQGASTITQQLVKLRLLNNQVSLDRKIKEAVLAVQVEHSYSKNQILEMYLNTVTYGNNAQGAEAAARIFFHKQAKDLTLAEASMLAGIPQSPLYNSPFTNWDQAKSRQKTVLDAMVRNHDITRTEADAALAVDLRPPDHMFKAGPQVFAAPGFTYWVIDQLKAKYGEKTAYGGGLRILTTIDPNLQAIAEKSVIDQVAANQRSGYHVTQGALVSIDPHTGAVLAMVGAADTTKNGGQFNMALWPPRNPGSSFKIFDYTAAIASSKFTSTTYIQDTPLKITLPPGSNPPTYEPKNYDLGYHGTCQLQVCMGNSLNVPAVKVELGVGVPAVATMARAMGAPPWVCHGDCSPGGTGSWTNTDPLDYYGYSLTLGGYGETPLQMATAASVLGAQGMLHPSYAITNISSSDGTVIYKVDPARDQKQVIDARVAYIMEQIMSTDSNRAAIFGRGSALTLPGRTVGAKTGTTDVFTDGWTVGYTPDVATAVWMGNTDFTGMGRQADAIYVAAPAWHNYMQATLDAMGKGNVWFNEPPGLDHYNGLWYLPGTNPSTQAPPLPSNAVTFAPPTPKPTPTDSGSPPPGGGAPPPPTPTPGPTPPKVP